MSKVLSMPRQVRGGDSELKSYNLALTQPFSPDAIGARVPDMYSAPTATYHSRGTMVLQSNASGVASVLLTASPLFSTVDMTGASISTTGQNVVGNSNSTYSAATLGNLAGVLSTCRVVGCGFQIKNLIPPTTATGRVIMAAMPMCGDVPGWRGAINSGMPNNVYLARMTGLDVGTIGVSTTLGIPASILASPDAQECTIQDVIATTVQMVCKPVSPRAFDFHNTDSTVASSAAQSVGSTAVYTTATGAPVVGSIDNLNVTNYDGWEALLVRFEGLPVNTIVAEIEYVYHYEGTPQVGISSAGNLYPDAPPKTHININGHNNVLSGALSKKCFTIMSDAFNGDLFSAGLGGAKLLAGKKRSRQAGNAMQNAFAKLGLSF